MIVELIRDNRKIVDRITQDQIEMFVGLLRLNKVSHIWIEYWYTVKIWIINYCDVLLTWAEQVNETRKIEIHMKERLNRYENLQER